jgi:Lipid A disaccharide synthetase
MKYYIIAGEASGDLHGSNLIKGIKSEDNNAEIRAWGGDLMSDAGANIVKHYRETAIMGFVEVLMNIDKIFKNLSDCKKDILSYKPDVIILIDYPGFNFKIAKFAKEKGFKVFYYIAPKVWAWKEKRVHRLQKYVDKLFIIFPFEIDYFKKWNIDAIYEGNPLLDSVDNYTYINESKENFFNRISSKKVSIRELLKSIEQVEQDKPTKPTPSAEPTELTKPTQSAKPIQSAGPISQTQPTIALLAGSRKMEINFLFPKMLEIAQIHPNYKFILAAAPSIDINTYKKIILKFIAKKSIDDAIIPDIDIVYGETYSILRHSDAAIISSGTASLEAALIGVPQMVCYGGNPLSFAIAKFFVKLKYISLANLILNKQIFKELLQGECNRKTIDDELDKLLNDNEYRSEMNMNYQRVKEVLGGEGASKKIAKAMINELKK